MKYKFSENFWWGASCSGPQTEGAASEDGKSPTIWDYWYKKEPTRFFDGVGPQNTSNFYHMYKEDVKIMKSIGLNSFRTSIQWARLIPEGTGKVNPKAVKFYSNLIDELIKNGIEPFICLFHFDMPMCMQKKGGWESREVVDAYAAYAKKCFELFGKKVKFWFTHNEPIVPVEGGYLYDFHYPNIVDFKKAAQVAYHTALANALAIEQFRECQKAKKINTDGKIGIILNLSPTYPRSQNEADLKAAKIADLLVNKSFLDPAVKGRYPQELIALIERLGAMPKIQRSDLKIIKENTVDILGINYYQPRRAKAKECLVNPEAPVTFHTFFDDYAMPGRKINPHRGWEIYEKGVYDLLIDVKKNYGNIQTFVSENGMGVEGEGKFRNKKGYIEDDYRIAFIKDHLRWLHKAQKEKCNVKGYFLWSYMDNWSWTNAYKNRYGYVEVDLKNNYKRIIKKSGYWIKEVAKNNGF